MCSIILPCPLCSQPNFPSVDALRISLVNVTNRQLSCPICNEILIGLDKLTIHLFSHTINCNSSISSTSISLNKENLTSTDAYAPTTAIDHHCRTTTTIENNIKNEQINARCGIEKNINNNNNDDNDHVAADHDNDNKDDGDDDDDDDDDDDATQTSLQSKSYEKVKSLYETTINDECKKIQQPSNLSSSPFHQSITPPRMPLSPSPPPPPLPASSIISINSLYELSRESTTIIASSPPLAATVSPTLLSPPSPLPPPPQLSKNIHHNNEHTLFIEPQCDICGLTFRNSELHSMHMKLVHEIDISDVNINNLLMINRSHKIICMDDDNQSQKRRYQCHLCSKSFKMKGALRVHLRVVHLFGVPGVLSNNSGGGFGGGGGGSSFINNIRNNYHQMKIPLERNNNNSSPPIQNVAIKCEIDKNALPLSNGISLNSNLPDELYMLTLNVEHSGNNSPLQQQEEFDRQQQQQQHQEQHQQQQQIPKQQQQSTIGIESKVWECDICTKLFTTKYFLKKHKRLHTGEMPYTCEICAKTFTFQQSYHKHLLYHNDDKPHVCKECGRAFKELSTLHNHERIHSGEKPFKCETCDKCFRQRVSYLVHRRIHTGVMPYKCTACDKSFRYKVSQRTHKCMAQPPGTVIRQTGDLLQRLIQSTVLNSMQQLNSTTTTNLDDQNDDYVDDADDAVDDDDDDDAVLKLEQSNNVETQTITNNFSSQYLFSINNNNNVCTNSQEGVIDGIDGCDVDGIGGSVNNNNGIVEDNRCNDIRDVEISNNYISNEFGHQSLDELVEEHCNKIGIGQNVVNNNFCSMDMNNDHHSFDISIPSPTEKFQNLCLYSPQSQPTSPQLPTTQTAIHQPMPSSPTSEEIFTHTLDTIDENLLKQFLYGKDI